MSILDFCTSEVHGSIDGVNTSLELAMLADRLGYKRYWFAEHHELETSHSTPELLVGVAGCCTSRIRLGTGGILLRYYSPLKVVKTFRCLNSVLLGRVDLGIAGGVAGPLVGSLLSGDPRVHTQEVYERKFAELCRLNLDRTGLVNPIDGMVPELWITGAGRRTVELAASNGASLCLGLFAGEDLVSLAKHYVRRFIPTVQQQRPKLAIAVAGVCSRDREKAIRMAAAWTGGIRPAVVGGERECGSLLRRLARLHNADEILFYVTAASKVQRSDTYEALARAIA